MKARLILAVTLLALAARAHAEPIFLARQYTRCTTCHYSPTGGGLLTPYGRSLTEELSTTGTPNSDPTPGHAGEHNFLWGRLGQKLGPLDLGFDTRPAYLSVSSARFTTTQTFLMNADLTAAVRTHGWTLYGEIGREPVPAPDGPKIASYEYWIAHDSENGLGFRVGRFLPAYGIRVADHTALTRLPLGFDVFDQVLALEVSHSTERHLLQLSVGPGAADAYNISGRRALTATGRLQLDLNSRTAFVFSALHRQSSSVTPQNDMGGVAFGFSPTKHISIWTEGDVQRQGATSGTPAGTGYTLLNETGIEVYRGLWLKLSPQFRTSVGDTSGGTIRTVIEADLFPRTHFNPDIAFYRDRDRKSQITTTTILAQMHVYF